MLTYEVEYNDQRKIIITRVHGEITPDDAGGMGLKIRKEAKRRDYRIIFDYRDTHNRVSKADVHLWLDQYYTSMDPELKNLKTVLLYDAKDKEIFEFTELSWANQGAMIRVMRSEEEALEWLTDL